MRYRNILPRHKKYQFGIIYNSFNWCRHDRNCKFNINYIEFNFGLTMKSLSTVKWELMKPTQRPSVSLVTETGMFLWMPSLLINGGTLLSLLFGLSSSLPPLVGGGGGLVCESVGKADLLSGHFDGKQSAGWLSARPMHVVEHLTSWWLMFLT